MRDRDQLFAELNRSDFRRRFQLSRAEQEYLADKSLTVVLRHARDFVLERLAPASPHRDGKQTSMRGHPVFVAQHATATCCRGCLAKWHHIAKGTALTDTQIDYIVEVIEYWLARQETAETGRSAQQRLF